MTAVSPELVAENVVQAMSFFGTNFEDTWEFHVSRNMKEGQDVGVVRKLVSEILREKDS